MLHLSEHSDAQCSRSANASKLVSDFYDEPSEKTMTPKSFSGHNMKTFNLTTPIPLNAGVERHFSLFIAQSARSLAMPISKCLYV